jgi:hypothetical protein
MTCQQLRLYFEDPLQRDAERRPEAELMVHEHVVHEHLLHCADCASFVETQRKLGTSFRLILEAVPTVSASLDDSVLANYRRQIAEGPVPTNAVLRRHRVAVSCWSAAVAIMLASGILLFNGRKVVITTVTQPRLPQSARASQPPVAAAVVAPIGKPRALHATAHRALRQTSVRSVTALANPVPAAFHSLMYCDELSCGGTLDVIRVALRSSVTALAASSSTNGVVLADVLVGPDGIARGIRIVE